jgi:hypothetical protein
MTFRISALPIEPFLPLFAMDDAALQAAGGRRVVADTQPGYPCRVSLADAQVGERLILVHWQHQPAPTPFRASHAVYVRTAAIRAEPATGEIPALLRSRALSMRGFDTEGMMVAATLSDGFAAEHAIAEMLQDANVAYIHLHYAGPGCYAARADRA